MPNPNEAREEAWRAFTDEYTRWAARGIDEPIEFDYAWVARGRYDEQRIAALKDALRRYMLYVDSYGYEPHGPLSQAFGPVEHPGSSISTEAWLDRVRMVAMTLYPSANLWDIIGSADIAPRETWFPRA